MRHNRYQQPEQTSSDQAQLPTDTVCTILVRQSTSMQAMRHMQSAEVNPDELVELAAHIGFDRDHIRVVDDDMGIGAYSTTIEDRPGLTQWLFTDLPQGVSKVVLASAEDRLFRDRDEVEHNRFIRDCVKHGGWAICGQGLSGYQVYDFRRKFDQDRFRWACKTGKEFIEGHLKARLHPSIHRAAMDGRYPGGPVPMGYLVDYEQRSPTFKHFVRYEPHASLVSEHVFRVFAGLPHPSTVEVARHWAREGLVWPFFDAEVDPRRVRVVDAMYTRDENFGGYLFHFRQAYSILTSVAYLGWKVHRRRLATDAQGQPLICHEPLVDDGLFWWCYDRLVTERPAWAPPRPSTAVVSVYRPHMTRRRDPTAVPFLAPGRVRCAVHGTPLGAVSYPNGSVLLRCRGNDRFHVESATCSALSTSRVDDVIARSFIDQLVLDERDAQELARIAERRERRNVPQPGDIQRQLVEQRTYLTNAQRLAVRAEDEQLRAGFFAQAEEAVRTIRTLEQQLAMTQAEMVVSPRAWTMAERAVALAERIRATFLDWPRPAQMRVLTLALQEGVLGRCGRYTFGLWLRWYGDTETRAKISTTVAQFTPWTEAERDALRQWYPRLTWEALMAMFPGRTQPAIKREVGRLGVARPRGGPFAPVAPLVFPTPQATNEMEVYGIQAAATGPPAATPTRARSETTVVRDAVSRQSTRNCSCGK